MVRVAVFDVACRFVVSSCAAADGKVGEADSFVADGTLVVFLSRMGQ